MTDYTRKPHHGRNLTHVRNLLGISPEALAEKLGTAWDPTRIKALEGKELIDDIELTEIARVLNIPVEGIKNYDAEQIIWNIQNNNSGAVANGLNNYNCTFNNFNQAATKKLKMAEQAIKEQHKKIKEKSVEIAKLQKKIKRLEGRG